MNYIYDISLNFKNRIYDFYEWKKEDKINFILKIPIFKIDKDLFYNLYFNEITIDKSFLSMICNKTDIYYPNSINKIKYAAIFSNEEKAVAISFSEDGKNILKSILSIEEEEEVIEFSKLIKGTVIEYKVNKLVKSKEIYLTRKEQEDKIKAKKYIKNLYDIKSFSKLKYIFFEIYNYKENDIENIYLKLNKIIDTNSNKINNLTQIINDIKKNENPIFIK